LYRDLIDLYMDTEQPLCAIDFDRLARKICCDEHDKPALMAVLDEFFTVDGDVYRNGRCDVELAKFHSLVRAASRAGKVSAERRANAKATGVERALNGRCSDVPPTNTQYPIPKEEKAPAAPSLTFGELEAEGLTAETAAEFLALRNRKRAKLTRRAWEPIKAEVAKAGWTLERAITECLVRGWVAFKADWVKEKANPADIARLTVPSRPSTGFLSQDKPMTPEEREAARKAAQLALGSMKLIKGRA
jgi:uncharacterized protein YdaU (DUF1376 family)